MASLIVILIVAWAWDELSAASRLLLTTCYQIMSEDVIVIIITGLLGGLGLVSGHVPADDEEEEEERDQEHGMKFLLCLLP